MENFTSLPNQKWQSPNKLATIENNNPIKVKYISNPMMVKAKNESEFRAIVQKLTGQHSADEAFDQLSGAEQFNHVFNNPLPSTTMAASFDTKDCYGSVSGDVYDPVGVGEGRYWRGGEMEGCSFSGFQQASSCVDIW